MWGFQTLVDQPIVVAQDTKVGRKFLLCDYSRDGDSFRFVGAVFGQALPIPCLRAPLPLVCPLSVVPTMHVMALLLLWPCSGVWGIRSPWSNEYFPACEDGYLPSDKLRALEVEANELFDAYRELYYEADGSLSSVYLWTTEEGVDPVQAGFNGCWLIKKGAPVPVLSVSLSRSLSLSRQGGHC
jgi:hypothetical protein